MHFIASALLTNNNAVLTVDEPRGIRVRQVQVSIESGSLQLELYRTSIGGVGTVVGNVESLDHGSSVTSTAVFRTVGFSQNADEKVGSWFIDAGQPLRIDFPEPGLEIWPLAGLRWGLVFKIDLSSNGDIAYNCYFED